MNTETIRNIVNLFLHCQKYIPNPIRISYSDVKSLLSPIVDEMEYDSIVKSIFNSSDHYFLTGKPQHPADILVEINSLAGKINANLSPNRKLVLLSILMRLMKINGQQDNAYLERGIFCVAEMFSYDAQQMATMKRFFLGDEISKPDYENSVLITNQPPDYIEVIEGQKAIYDPKLKFKIWVINIKSINNLLFKILDFNAHESIYDIKVGDILIYARPIESLLEESGITLNDLSAKIITNSNTPGRIAIPATDRSPEVILDSLEGRVEVRGVSMTLPDQNFYEPIFYWLERIKEQKPKEITMHLELSFFNTYTSKIILNLMNKLLELEKLKCNTKICWYHEENDQDLREAGEHYASIINTRFTFVSTGPMSASA
jgi:hypothetical protein